MVVNWLPVEIHPEIPPEGLQLPAHVRAHFGGASEYLRQQAQEAGMEMVVPEVIPNSRRALEAAEYAREQGKHPAFHKAVFHKLYAEGQDIARWEVLRDAAEMVGLDSNEMQRKTGSGAYTAFVDAQKARLISLGATGVPLFVFDDKYVIIGLRPYEAFQEVMAHLSKEKGVRSKE